MDDEDHANGWNLKKMANVFKLNTEKKNHQKILWSALCAKISFEFFLIILQEHFVHNSRQKTMILAKLTQKQQNPRDSAKFSTSN